MEKEDFMLENFKNCQDMIRLFEQKANILLIVYGVLLTYYIQVSNLLKYTALATLGFIEAIKAVSTFLLLVSSIIIFIYGMYLIIYKILMPSSAKYYNDQKKSVFYFGHISSMEKDCYRNTVIALKDDNILGEIIDQVYEVSKIAQIKQDNYAKVSKLLFLNLVMIIVLSILIC